MAFKIYTRTGDEGTSALYSGVRRDKQDPIFEALGSIDELNACLGLAADQCVGASDCLVAYLREMQCCLIEIGSSVATPRASVASSSQSKVSSTAFDAEGMKTRFARRTVMVTCRALERAIDHLDAQLPPLTNFILPHGGLCGGFLHQARAVCRRAERAACALSDVEPCEPSVLVYLNRASDFLFVAARFASHT